MPDFLGIGAQKAGTTWLYHQLAHHPDVRMPDCKEVHFWDRHYDEGYAWYNDLFAKDANKITGEITPAYAILPPETIAEIATHYPDVRLIFMVRDPIARAWSAALMDAGLAGLSPENLPDSWFIEHFHSAGSRMRGDYATCLRQWLGVFPKEQLLLLDYQAIKSNPRTLLKSVAQHIGVTADFYDILAEEKLRERKNENAPYKLRESLAPELHALYADAMEDFSRYYSY